ncbi:MAG: HAMP domain-containing histidine kinase [Sphingobacteriaceae bacterium]|nr:HAMP domain-containing histidine kinase [Sphingobacteriaceae bacterium]
MKKKSLWVISFLMTASILGVLSMQLYYIREGYNLKKQLFEQNVNEALNAVVNRVQKRTVINQYKKYDDKAEAYKERKLREKTDNIIAFKEHFKATEEIRKRKQLEKSFAYLYFQDSVIRKTFLNPRIITEEEFNLLNNNPLEANQLNNSIYGNNVLNRQITLNIRKQKIEMMQGRLPDTLRYLALESNSIQPRIISLPTRDEDLTKRFAVEDAIEEKKYQQQLDALFIDSAGLNNKNYNLVADVAKEMKMANIPLQKRIDKNTLDTLIKSELNNRNIFTPYLFSLSLAKKDSVIFAFETGKEALDKKNTYKAILFNADMIKDPGILSINFPNRRTAIISTMSFNLLSSLLLLVVLVFVFTYTMNAIITQKKLSEMKNDFINNMTHEFKTPVATIMLASEALKDPDLNPDKTKITKLANIIFDENVRLSNHIERVLNVAKIENKEITFVLQPVDINEVIKSVALSMDLSLKNKNSKLILNLDARPSYILGDELQMSDMIYNLLDNAIKYSQDEPHITINTFTQRNKLVLQVTDQGIGITKEQIKHIFDQFYRVSTGNLHNVKGFGLGLNYVQKIVSQMNGDIKVFSEKDKGSTFEISFPVRN